MSTQSGIRIVAMVPAYREERTVARTVRSLLAARTIDEVVVLEDGSPDRTAERASAAGARVVRSPGRLGKGRAVDRALEQVAADVYLLVDADVGDTAECASTLLEPVLGGRLDLVVGRLPSLPGGGFGLVKRTAGLAIRWASHGYRADAPLSGQRAVTREALFACRPLASGFGLEAAMTIDAVRLGFRVGEISVDMTHRATGRSPSGFAHRGRQGIDIAKAVAPRVLGLR